MLRVLISVPQTFSMEMRQGIKVSIEISELPGLRFQGIVSNVSGAIDTVSRTLLTEIHVPNRNGRLLPGMYVLVHFILPKKSGALLIPTNALTYDANGTRVAIVTPASVIHEEPIVVGRDFGPEIEITKGLNGQEKVVTNPSDSLVEGLKVQAKASPPPAGNQPQQPGHPNETIQHGVTPVKLPIRKPGISDFPENDELDALKGAPHDNSPLVALDHSVRGDRPRR
jgi:multidrug efflux pump subunit AcrA (membrane-fusion protein)